MTPISSFKIFEFDIVYSNSKPWFLLHLDWSRNTDHAGLNFEICLFGYSIESKIYDTRHWDYENNTWKKNEFPKNSNWDMT